MSRHLDAVATSAWSQKQSRQQFARKLRSRQHQAVVTSTTQKGSRDIIQRVAKTFVREEGRNNTWLSRHQLQRKEVATRSSCRDISCRDQRVATTSRGRDIKYKELSRDVSKLSRYQLHKKKVATRSSCRDISFSKGMSQPNKGFCDKD